MTRTAGEPAGPRRQPQVNANVTDQEIDAAVAACVMGWHYEQIDAGGGAYHVRWYDDDGSRLFAYMVGERSVIGIPWQPTRDIAHAWRVLEAIQGSCKISVVAINEREWGCNIVAKGKLFCRVADTAPMAICLCALDVVAKEP